MFLTKIPGVLTSDASATQHRAPVSRVGANRTFSMFRSRGAMRSSLAKRRDNMKAFRLDPSVRAFISERPSRMPACRDTVTHWYHQVMHRGHRGATRSIKARSAVSHCANVDVRPTAPLLRRWTRPPDFPFTRRAPCLHITTGQGHCALNSVESSRCGAHATSSTFRNSHVEGAMNGVQHVARSSSHHHDGAR
jgi:hypothetical protein